LLLFGTLSSYIKIETINHRLLGQNKLNFIKI